MVLSAPSLPPGPLMAPANLRPGPRSCRPGRRSLLRGSAACWPARFPFRRIELAVEEEAADFQSFRRSFSRRSAFGRWRRCWPCRRMTALGPSSSDLSKPELGPRHGAAGQAVLDDGHAQPFSRRRRRSWLFLMPSMPRGLMTATPSSGLNFFARQFAGDQVFDLFAHDYSAFRFTCT
jgi:hypothetical protein